jgi:S-DNA-T family DNA segregation ATPase FtsK/SpoIIIE
VSEAIRKPPAGSELSGLTPRAVALLRESWWLALVGAGAYLFLILHSYDRADPGWSHATDATAIANIGGEFGAWLADLLLWVFGLSAYWLIALCMYLIRWAYRCLDARAGAVPPHPIVWLTGFVLLLLGSSGLEALRFWSYDGPLPLAPGGMLGLAISQPLAQQLGFTGATMMLVLMMAVGSALFLDFSWLRVAEQIGAGIERICAAALRSQREWRDRRAGVLASVAREDVVLTERRRYEEHEPIRIEPALLEIEPSQRVVKEKARSRQRKLFEDLPDSPLPPLALLDEADPAADTISNETLEFTSRLIEKKLADFGVVVRVVAAYPGPVITRYEIEPAVGVKGSQVVGLMRDLARALSVVSIRVIETIPGKSYMALEIPNPHRQVVRLSEILGSQPYADLASPLTIALGKDIGGKPTVADLARMPHVLLAGTTGSGKSVALNAIIVSLLYKATPADTRLILIDPKMLELSVYEGIPHLLAPVVTDMKEASAALHWCVAEMERRYRLMSALGVRNLAGYNQRVREAERNGQPLVDPTVPPAPEGSTAEPPQPLATMPLIVVVVDELADMMMSTGKKVEELIARLAQKARAAGIHLVLATQRPSVDVITGLIKANVPTRIAFQVSSKIDSRTILDQMGAEALLGQGDMLYLPPGTGYPQRVHGAFVSDAEVHRVVDYLKKLGEPDYVPGVLSAGDAEGGDEAGSGAGDAESDPLYDQAVAIVLKTRRPSISLVQRHLRIGYNRSARLIEQMERAGLVSGMQGNGNREVLVPESASR